MKLNNYEFYLEQVQNTNKETLLDDHTKNVQYYNANKDKFDNIFLKDESKWEEEAKKLIDGNVYLSSKWKISKIEKQQKELEDKLKEAELTFDEKTDINNKILELKKQVNDEIREIDKKISQDLSEIKSL
jgi:TRAP-type C4-dicarboxylate transport system substrate-binding protein